MDMDGGQVETDNLQEYSGFSSNPSLFEGHTWLPKLSVRLVRVFCKDHLAMSRRYATHRAFQHWSRNVLLIQKCDELGKQLSERNEVLNNFRECYLRDVISMKYQLQQQIRKGTKESALNREAELKAIPSIDLREYAARGLTDQSSLHYHDSVPVTSLDDALKEYLSNPWEHSSSFRKLLTFEKRKLVEVPEVDSGGTIQLYAPAKFKLFVKYCKSCVGIMTLVRDWNEIVEISVKKNFDNKIAEKKIEDLMKIIEERNQVIMSKNDEIEKLIQRNTTLESCAAWFNNWDESKAVEAREEEMKKSIQKWKNMAKMSVAEIESVAFTIGEKMDKKVLELQKQIHSLEDQLNVEKKIRSEKEILLIEANEEIRRKANRIGVLDAFISKQKTDMANQKNEIDKLDVAKELANDMIAALQRELASTQQESDSRLEQRNQQLHKLSLEIDVLQKTNADHSHRMTFADFRELNLNTKIRGLENALANMSKKYQMSSIKGSRPDDVRLIRELIRKLELATSLLPRDIQEVTSTVFKVKKYIPTAPPPEDYTFDIGLDMSGDFDDNDVTAGDSLLSGGGKGGKEEDGQRQGQGQGNDSYSSQPPTPGAGTGSSLSASRHGTTTAVAAVGPKLGEMSSSLSMMTEPQSGGGGSRRIPPTPKERFKGVIHVIRFVLMYYRYARRNDLKSLGTFGMTLALSYANLKILKLERLIKTQTDRLAEIEPALEVMTVEKYILDVDNKMLRLKNDDLLDEIKEASKKLRAARKTAEDCLTSSGQAEFLKQLNKEKSQLKIMAQMQRTLAYQLSTLLVFARKKISVLLNPRSEVSNPPVSLLNIINNLSVEELLEIKSKGINLDSYAESKLKKARIKYMADKLRAVGRDLCLWIRKHKNDRGISVIKIEDRLMDSELAMTNFMREDERSVSVLQTFVFHEFYSLERLCSRLRSDRMSALNEAAEFRMKLKRAEDRESALTLSALRSQAAAQSKQPENASRLKSGGTKDSKSSSSVSKGSKAMEQSVDRTSDFGNELNDLRLKNQELERLNNALLKRFNREKADTHAQTDPLPTPAPVTEEAKPAILKSGYSKKGSMHSLHRSSSMLNYISQEQSEQNMAKAIGELKVIHHAEMTRLIERESLLSLRLNETETELIKYRALSASLALSKEQLEIALDDVALDYRYIDHQNILLRAAVRDGYRAHSDEVERILAAVATDPESTATPELGSKYNKHHHHHQSQPSVRRKSKGTQISCAVCALRPADPSHGTGTGTTTTTGMAANHMMNALSNRKTDRLIQDTKRYEDMAGVDLKHDKLLTTRPRNICEDNKTIVVDGNGNSKGGLLHSYSIGLQSYLTEMSAINLLEASNNTNDPNLISTNNGNQVRNTDKDSMVAKRAVSAIQLANQSTPYLEYSTDLQANSRFRQIRNIPYTTPTSNATHGLLSNNNPSSLVALVNHNTPAPKATRLPTSESVNSLPSNNAGGKKVENRLIEKRLTSNTAAFIQKKIVDTATNIIPKGYETVRPLSTSCTSIPVATFGDRLVTTTPNNIVSDGDNGVVDTSSSTKRRKANSNVGGRPKTAY